MGALKNPKHEKFCQEYVRGPNAGNATKAYGAAGFKADRHNAAALLRKNHISLRVRELQGQVQSIEAKATAIAIEKTALSKEWVIERLMHNAEVALGMKMTKQKIKVPRSNRTVEIEVTERDAAAANRALELLGREVGALVERKIHTHEHASKSTEQLRAECEAIAAELGIGTAGGKAAGIPFPLNGDTPTAKPN